MTVRRCGIPGIPSLCQSGLARDPLWGRSEQVYGEDPFLNGTMAVAFIKGLQGGNPKYWRAAALLKQFLANSHEDHRNVSSSNFDERVFWEYYSVPFRMGFLESGANVSAEIKRRHFGRFWRCRDRRRRPLGTRRHRRPEGPATLGRVCSLRKRIKPWGALPRRQLEQELRNIGRAWCPA